MPIRDACPRSSQISSRAHIIENSLDTTPRPCCHHRLSRVVALLIEVNVGAGADVLAEFDQNIGKVGEFPQFRLAEEIGRNPERTGILCGIFRPP